MAQMIMMAREYRCKPSDILGLTDWAAYCFNEVAFYLLAKAMDNEGRLNWGRIRWVGEKLKGNKDFMAFVQDHKGR